VISPPKVSNPLSEFYHNPAGESRKAIWNSCEVLDNLAFLSEEFKDKLTLGHKHTIT
jgi:hypothetical protein